MSLRYKILAAVIGITVVVLTLVLAVVLLELVSARKSFEPLEEGLRERTITWVRETVEEVSEGVHPALRHAFVRDVIHIDGAEAKGQIWVQKGKVSIDDAEVMVPIRDLVRRAIREETTIRDGNTFAIPDPSEGPGLAPGGTWFSLHIPEFNPYEPLRRVYVVMVVGVVVIILVIYVVISRSVIRPIERLERAARRLAKGDYSRPVPLAGRDDEIDTLVETFNATMMELGTFRQHLEERVDDARQQAKDAESSLVIAQRLAATGQLASGIAHEVNNPLAGMQNAARRLKRAPPPDDAKREEYLDLIIDGLLRIQETVKKILRFTPHKVAPQAVSIETVLQRSLALASHRIEKEGLEVFVDLPVDATVFGDPFELQQVFLNVLINAMDAVATGGRKGEITIRGTQAGGELRIEVADNGCGMTEEQIGQAFDLFFTSKEVGEGTGLGLSIAHHVINNHGGRISLESEDGRGTTVAIVLPLLEGGS
jgi:signal transduction histidine kinase